MSEFDKEAERQKLREKYERDEKKRQSTQRMSELLLKGATMTNKHCDQCGDPIFRYDGQEFCPTCQTEGRAAASADADAEDAAEAVADAESTPGSDEDATTPQQTADATTPQQTADATRPTTAASTQATNNQPATERGAAERDSAGDQTQFDGVAEVPSAARRNVSGDVSSARESLVRTLTWAANQAESTDDPRRAAEFLTAAREAAEAIAALDR